MSVKITTARFSTPTSTGSVDWTDSNLGGSTPKAAIFIFGGVTADGAAEVNLIGGIGFASSSNNEFNSSIYSQDGVGTTNTWRNQDNNSCINQVFNGSFLYSATFTSFIQNGVRLNFSAITPTARFVTVIFFAGSDLIAHANVINLGTDLTAIDETNPGFNPDIIFLSSSNTVDSANAHNNANLSFGFAVNDGSETNRGISWCDFDDESTSLINCKIYTDAVGGQVSNDTESYKVTVSDFDSSGFSITQSAASNDEINYLAISFGGAAAFNLRSVDSPITTGNDIKTGLSYKPTFIMLGLTDLQSEDSLETGSDAGSFGISCFTKNAEFCNSWASEDNQSTSDTQRLSDNQAINFASGDGSTQYAATFSSFQSDGYTLNYTTADVTARKWFELSIHENIKNVNTFGFGPPIFRGSRVGRAVKSLNGSLFEDTDTFNTGDVHPINLFGSLFEDSDTFNGAIVDAPAPGNQGIIRSTFLNSSSLFHGIVRPTNMFGSLLEDSDTLNDGEIGGSRQLEGHDHNNESIFYHGRVLLDLQELDGELFSDADTLHQGALTFGEIDIQGSKLGDSVLVLDSVTTNSATIESSHSISIPNESNQTNRKLIVAVSANDSVTFTWPSGWSEILDTSTASVSLSVAHKTIDGTEGFGGSNDTITVTTSSSKVVTAIAYLVNENFADIEIDSATGTSTSPNPPSLTPSNGYDNYLNIAVIGHDSGSTSTTAYPSGFVNNQAVRAGTLTTGCGIAGSHLIIPGSSIDPGAFTISQSRSWIAATVSIRSSEVALIDNVFHGSLTPDVFGSLFEDTDTFYHGSLYKGVRLTSSQRNYTAGHENPGVYTLDNSNDWIAVTIAIR